MEISVHKKKKKKSFSTLSFFISAHKASVSIWGLQRSGAKLRVPAHRNSPDCKGIDKGECIHNSFNQKKKKKKLSSMPPPPLSEIITSWCVPTDGPRCYDTSRHSSPFESRKGQLPVLSSRVLTILRIVTLKQTHCTHTCYSYEIHLYQGFLLASVTNGNLMSLSSL